MINTKSDDDTDGTKRDELIFELIKRRFDQEIQRTQNLDQKAGTMVGFVSVLVGLLLGSGSLLGDDETVPSIFKSDIATKSTYLGGVAMLLSSVGVSMIALKVRKWQTVPNVQILLGDFINFPHSKVLQTTAVEMAKAVAISEQKNDSKGKFIGWSWYLLIAGLALVFVAVTTTIR